MKEYSSLNAQKPKKKGFFSSFLISIKSITILRIIEINGRFNLGLFFAALRPILLVFIIGVFIRGYDASYGISDALKNVLFCGAVFFFIQEIMRGVNFLDQRKYILYLPNTNHLSIVLSVLFASIFIFTPIFISCFILFGLLNIEADLIGILKAILLASFFGLSYLITVSFFCFNNNIIQQFASYVPLIALFTSCVFYPFSSVPNQYKEFFLLNPIVHIIETVRQSTVADSNYTHIDSGYVILFSVLLLSFSIIGYLSNIKQ